MKRFCYKCGALETERGPLVQGLCQQCFARENRLLRAPAELEVVICKRCGAYLLGKRWREAIDGDALTNAIQETTLSNLRVVHLNESGTHLLKPQEVRELELSIVPKLRNEVIEVKAQGKVHEFQTEPQLEEARIKLNLKSKTCDICSLKSAGHHEAILQVRGELLRDKRFEIKKFLEQIATEASRRDRSAFIAKIEDTRGGIDLHVNPVSLAKLMASSLRENFGAKLKESAKLIGMEKSGRKKFRISILARVPGNRD